MLSHHSLTVGSRPQCSTPGQGRRLLLRAAAVAAAGDVVSGEPLGPLIWGALVTAAKSGSAGFVAGTMQVLMFMWLRTAMNYQYKFGGTLAEVLKKLYAEGGVARLYRGLFPWAIFQAPLSRFGDVATNDLVITLSKKLLPNLPVSAATVAGSYAAAAFRVVITPIDTFKTILQTDGSKGLAILQEKIKKGGLLVLWAGWQGNYMANVVGNYPFFATMNALQQRIPVPKGALAKLVRSAFLGAVSSSVSDVVANSIRVVKTKKQTHTDANIGYVAAAQEVVSEDGVAGLMFRGLETRIFTNVLQGAFFTVLWKYLSQ